MARRTREKSGWPVGVGFGSAVAAGVGAGGGAAAAAIGFCEYVGLGRVLVFTFYGSTVFCMVCGSLGVKRDR